MVAAELGILRWSLSKALKEFRNILVVGDAQDDEDLIGKYFSLKPDIALVNISRPKLDGFKALQRIKEIEECDAKFLFIIGSKDTEYVNKVIDFRGIGFLDKSVNEGELYYAICEVAKGNNYFEGNVKVNGLDIKEKVCHQDEQIHQLRQKNYTDCENKIINLYGQGLSTTEIAVNLYISKKTVDFHRGRIMKKMEIESYTKFISIATKLAL